MKLTISKDYEDLSSLCARHIAACIHTKPGALMCFAAGDTPLGTYRHLIELQKQGCVDLTSAFYVGLDEWMGLGYEDVGSCRQVMADNFYRPAGIPESNISVFDGLDEDDEGQIRRTLDFIEEHGSISLALLGIGMNGHIGFNEPGALEDFEGGVVNLDITTQSVGKKYFNKPYDLTQGITLGLKTLMSAREVLLMANGSNKAAIVQKSLCGQQDINIPASRLAAHSRLSVYLDQDAARLYRQVPGTCQPVQSPF